jgi:hypothetical protein
MNKSSLTISIDTDVLSEARRLNVKMSELCNSALRIAVFGADNAKQVEFENDIIVLNKLYSHKSKNSKSMIWAERFNHALLAFRDKYGVSLSQAVEYAETPLLRKESAPATPKESNLPV